jgi:hypothetical protein
MPVFGQVFDEFMATGAIVAGRGTFEPAAGWGGDHHEGVPIWVLSRREPGIDVSQWPLVTYFRRAWMARMPSIGHLPGRWPSPVADRLDHERRSEPGLIGAS